MIPTGLLKSAKIGHFSMITAESRLFSSSYPEIFLPRLIFNGATTVMINENCQKFSKNPKSIRVPLQTDRHGFYYISWPKCYNAEKSGLFTGYL